MYLALKRSTTQGSFFKNNSLTSFHPLLLKALLFSEIASPSSVPPPHPASPPSHPLPFLCHVLVFICWFCSSSFSPCVKNERPKIGWVRGEKRQEAKAATVHSWNHCLQCWDFSLLCTDSYGLQYSRKPNPYTSHSTNQTWSIDNAKCSICPLLKYCIPMWYSYTMTKRSSIDQPQAAA